MKKITIVLASYNGHKYIQQQVESILKSNKFEQLVEEIIITDDNSTDSTIDLINRFNCVSIKKNIRERGVVNNFLNGLDSVKTDYVMFCDQDDVWLEDKIEIAYQEMVKLESLYSSSKPLTNFCDLKIANENLEVLYDSFSKYHGINFERRKGFSQLVMNNIAPGCSCIINRKMTDYLLAGKKYVSDWIMHDWWIMLIASKLGAISFTNQSLMLYRQHSNNVVGYKKKKFFSKLANLKEILDEYRRSLHERLEQLQAFNDFLDDLNKNSFTEPSIDSNLMYVIRNECSNKRRICAFINFFRNGCNNRVKGEL